MADTDPEITTEPRLTGSFFDLTHLNLSDAAYWTDTCRFRREEHWRAPIREALPAMRPRPTSPPTIGSVPCSEPSPFSPAGGGRMVACLRVLATHFGTFWSAPPHAIATTP